MRFLTMGAALSALLTLVAALALRAADATLAVAAVAGVAVLFTWYAQLHSSEERSRLGLANPAAILTLAAHTVGAVLGGLAALGLDDRLGDTMVFTQPGLVVAALGAAIVGVIGAWTTLSIDGGGSEALAGIPAIAGGAILPLGLLTVFHPAAVVGLATAGLVPWDVALVAAGTALVASIAGAYAVSALVPQE